MPLRKIREPKKEERCLDPEHNPPQFMYYEDGTYEWECPRCHKKQIFTVNNIKMCNGYKGMSQGRVELHKK